MAQTSFAGRCFEFEVFPRQYSDYKQQTNSSSANQLPEIEAHGFWLNGFNMKPIHLKALEVVSISISFLFKKQSILIIYYLISRRTQDVNTHI